MTNRDRTRSPVAKARTLTRRQARRMAIARRFMALAFPADLSAFAPRTQEA